MMRGFLGLWAIGFLFFGVGANLSPVFADEFGPRFSNTPHAALMDDMALELQNIEPAAGGAKDYNFDDQYGGYIDLPDAVIEEDLTIKNVADKMAPVAL